MVLRAQTLEKSFLMSLSRDILRQISWYHFSSLLGDVHFTLREMYMSRWESEYMVAMELPMSHFVKIIILWFILNNLVHINGCAWIGGCCWWQRPPNILLTKWDARPGTMTGRGKGHSGGGGGGGGGVASRHNNNSYSASSGKGGPGVTRTWTVQTGQTKDLESGSSTLVSNCQLTWCGRHKLKPWNILVVCMAVISQGIGRQS